MEKVVINKVLNPDRRTHTIVEESAIRLRFNGEDRLCHQVVMRTDKVRGLEVDTDASGSYPTGKNWPA